MKLYFLIGFISSFYYFGFSQTLSTDITLARQYYTLGDSLQQYDSAILYFQKAATLGHDVVIIA